MQHKSTKRSIFQAPPKASQSATKFTVPTKKTMTIVMDA